MPIAAQRPTAQRPTAQRPGPPSYRPSLRRLLATLPIGVLLMCLGCVATAEHRVRASQVLYVRADTDRTTILSPRTALAADLSEHGRLEANYTVDIWTGASVDVRTAATAAIHETRHEWNVQGSYGLSDWTLSGSYRHSHEPDYLSHGGVLSAQADFSQNNTTLLLQGFGGFDQVGRAGDPAFSEPLSSAGGRVALTQVLNESTLAQLAYDATFLHGFQESVYRFVAIGGDGTCAGAAPYCLPEQVPDIRLRQTFSAEIKRALAAFASLSLAYRYYVDNWGLRSHTLSPQLAASPSPDWTLRLDYRLYTQGAADFYRARYFALSGVPGYRTRDRKLSPLYTHALALSAELQLQGDAQGPDFVIGARGALSRLHYRAFVGLQHVYALDLTATVSLSFE